MRKTLIVIVLSCATVFGVMNKKYWTLKDAEKVSKPVALNNG